MTGTQIRTRKARQTIRTRKARETTRTRVARQTTRTRRGQNDKGEAESNDRKEKDTQ